MRTNDGNVDSPALRERWHSHLAGIGSAAERDAVFDDLESRYAEPHRAYHNLNHIGQVLDVVGFLDRFVVDLRAVRLAAWFHDVIYDPRARDNEARSAAYAGETLKGLRYSPTAPVEAMILATRTHDHTRADLDTLVLLDADLAILGASPEVYEDYAAAVRKEYFWVPEARFYSGRSEVLERLLARKILFGLPEMRERFEAQARMNMEAELASLR